MFHYCTNERGAHQFHVCMLTFWWFNRNIKRSFDALWHIFPLSMTRAFETLLPTCQCTASASRMNHTKLRFSCPVLDPAPNAHRLREAFCWWSKSHRINEICSMVDNRKILSWIMWYYACVAVEWITITSLHLPLVRAFNFCETEIVIVTRITVSIGSAIIELLWDVCSYVDKIAASEQHARTSLTLIHIKDIMLLLHTRELAHAHTRVRYPKLDLLSIQTSLSHCILKRRNRMGTIIPPSEHVITRVFYILWH